MLLHFGVANHRSIRDYQEVLFTTSTSSDWLTMAVSVVDASVIPVTVFYGANASGKSNLLDAMEVMRNLIAKSHKSFGATDRILRFPFLLDANSARKPTRFECSFTLGAGSDEEPVYELDIEFTDHEICHERLRRTVRRERRSTHTLYTRRNCDSEVHVDFGAQLQGENRVTAKLTRANSLFLSAAAQNNHPQLTEVHQWFASKWQSLLSVAPISESEVVGAIANHDKSKWLYNLLQQAELGMGGIEIGGQEFDEQSHEIRRRLASLLAGHTNVKPDAQSEELTYRIARSTPKQLRLLHESGERFSPLDYRSESRGTRVFLTIALSALECLSTGSALLIDDLGSSLNPRLASAFVSLFLRRESNPHGAQLICSTHDIALLGSGLLTQDAIWLVDKDRKGVSLFTPLSDFKLRGDFESAYRRGRVGGLPTANHFFLDLTG